MRLSSRCFDADRISPAIRVLPLGPPDERPHEAFGTSPAGSSGPPSEARALLRLEAEIRFVPHPSFDDHATHREILGPVPNPSEGQQAQRVKSAARLLAYTAAVDGGSLLTFEQEAHLFRKMNFLKHQAAQCLEAINPAKPEAADFDRIEALQMEAIAVKDQIVLANVRLVVSFVKKLNRPGQEFAELVSEGYVALIRAAEKFDFSRGYKFSTYASWAIMNSVSRNPSRHRSRDRLFTGHDSVLNDAADHRNDGRQREADQEQYREAVRRMLGRLDDRERTIIVNRFGLEGTPEKTLSQLGKELGITKERVRQLEARARDKLREVAAAQKLDLSAS